MTAGSGNSKCHSRHTIVDNGRRIWDKLSWVPGGVPQRPISGASMGQKNGAAEFHGLRFALPAALARGPFGAGDRGTEFVGNESLSRQ
jgi:hypothetical protein